MMEQQSPLLARIRAIPPTRRVVVPDLFGRDDVGRIAAGILRLSAESQDEILVMLPPRGNISGALALAEVLRLPATAPTIGVLCGAAATSAPVLLQACTLRALSRHAEITPRPLENTHTVHSLMFVGPEAQTAEALETAVEELEAMIREQAAILEIVPARVGLAGDEFMTLLASKPEYSATEAMTAGWADAVI